MNSINYCPMEPLIIEGTNQLPSILFDKWHKTIRISGNSLPENPLEFYERVFEWFDRYIENPNEETRIEFKMDYFNTVSSKMIFEILKKTDVLYLKNQNVEVIWYYAEDDPDMEVAGEDFAAIVEAPFKLVSITLV